MLRERTEEWIGLSRGGEQTCHTSRDRRNAQQFLSGVAFVLAATPGRGRVSKILEDCRDLVRDVSVTGGALAAAAFVAQATVSKMYWRHNALSLNSSACEVSSTQWQTRESTQGSFCCECKNHRIRSYFFVPNWMFSLSRTSHQFVMLLVRLEAVFFFKDLVILVPSLVTSAFLMTLTRASPPNLVSLLAYASLPLCHSCLFLLPSTVRKELVFYWFRILQASPLILKLASRISLCLSLRYRHTHEQNINLKRNIRIDKPSKFHMKGTG